jgi:glycosyltransferase involved in cell wall biosynthesis
MGEYPRISVVTPVFNGAKYIQETIESVLSVSTPISIEYIIINDGSTDETEKILAKYSNEVSIHSFENQGESASVNKGLHFSRGDYVMVVNADDPILDDRIFDEAVQILDANPEIVAVYPDWQIIDESGQIRKKVVVDEFALETLIGRNKSLPGPGAVFRRIAALEIGGRRTKWKYVGDYDFWLRLSKHGNFKRIPNNLAQWREHSTSTSVSQKNALMAEERIQVIQEFIDCSNLPESLCSMAISNAHYMAAKLAYFDKSINGRRLMIEGLKKGRRFPSESHLIVILYLLTLPCSRFVSKIIPRQLVKWIVSS